MVRSPSSSIINGSSGAYTSFVPLEAVAVESERTELLLVRRRTWVVPGGGDGELLHQLSIINHYKFWGDFYPCHYHQQ